MFLCILSWLLISVLEGKPAGHRISFRRSKTSEAPDEAYSTSLENLDYWNQNTAENVDAYSQNHETFLNNPNDFNDKHSDSNQDTLVKAVDDNDKVERDTKNFFNELMDETDESNRVSRNFNQNPNDSSKGEEIGTFGNQQDDIGVLNEIKGEPAVSNEESSGYGTESNSKDFKNTQSDFENNVTESMDGDENTIYSTPQSLESTGPHDLKKSEKNLMAHRKKKARSSTDLRKTGSKFNKKHRQVNDQSHHVSPKAIMNKILNMMQIQSEDAIATTQWNSFTNLIEEFTNDGITSEKSLVEHDQISYDIMPMPSMTDTITEGIFSEQRSLNNPKTFNTKAGKSELNFPKTYLDKYRSSQVREKVKLVNEYHVKDEDLFPKPDLYLRKTRPQIKSTSTISNISTKTTQKSKVYYATTSIPKMKSTLAPSNFHIKTTHRLKVNHTTSILKNLNGFSTPSIKKTVSYLKRKKYPQSKGNVLSIPKHLTQQQLLSTTVGALSTRVGEKVPSLPETPQLTTSRYFLKPKQMPVTYSSPIELYKKAYPNNQDDALVVILRLPQMILHELSKVVSYGMEQTGFKSPPVTSTQFTPTFGKIRKGKELAENLSEKSLNDSDFTSAHTNAINSNKFIISTPSYNESRINTRSANGSQLTPRQKENGSSGMSTPRTNFSAPTTKKNLKSQKERNTVFSSLTSMLNTAALSQQLTTEGNLGRENVKNNLLSSLLSMLNQAALSQQMTTESQNGSEKEKGNLLSSLSAILNQVALSQQGPGKSHSLNESLKSFGNQTTLSESTTQFQENRPERQAPDFKAELQVFREMISGLVARLTDYINAKPNLTNLQKEFSITYMKKLLPEMIGNNMDELIKEVRKAAGTDRKKRLSTG